MTMPTTVFLAGVQLVSYKGANWTPAACKKHRASGGFSATCQGCTIEENKTIDHATAAAG